MNRKIVWTLVIVLLLAGFATGAIMLFAHSRTETVAQEEKIPAPEPQAPAEPEIPAYAKALIHAYPDFVKGWEDGEILFTDGSSMLCDDHRQKDYLLRVDEADIEDMFYDVYSPGALYEPEFLKDPGRYRCEAFFKKMYGSTEAEARSHLVNVSWFGQTMRFTAVNHAADSLRAVERDLRALSPQYDHFFAQSSTFNWRPVRGVSRLSPHSYGMAIDICVKYSNYWRWGNPGKSEIDRINYANRIPEEIVRIFERHGFISGVKWYHYDTMHFEFRPEILYYSTLL